MAKTIGNSHTGSSDPGLHVGRPFWASDNTGLQTGPSSSQSPYLVRANDHVSITSVATAGDQLPTHDTDYAFAGVPDGIGAFDNGDGTFTLLVNHELGATSGIVRDHGAKGAFVSELVIDKKTLAVIDADDLIQHVHLWNDTTNAYEVATTAFTRFCSGDLPAAGAIYNTVTGLGYSDGLIYFNGEETTNGRAFAHIVSGPEAGESFELPWLGQMAFENVVASPNSGDKTVLICTDDSRPGQVYVYIGEKHATGTAVEKAGLVGGQLYAVQVTDESGAPIDATPPGLPDAVLSASNEDRLTIFGPGVDTDGDGNVEYQFKLVPITGDVTEMNSAQLDAASDAAGATKFLRPEDGAWDTVDTSRFFFVTTDQFDADKANVLDGQVGRSRLWGLDFDNLSDPASGGRIEVLLDGNEPYQMLDNITVNSRGEVLLQEDPGGNDYLAKVWLYNPATDGLTLLAQHDPARFAPGGTLTTDEESSGIVDLTSILGRGNKDVYLMDVQAHYANGPVLVEGGQLLAMEVDFRGGWTL